MNIKPQDAPRVNSFRLKFCDATNVAIRILQTIAVCALALLLPFAALGYTSFSRTKRYLVPGTERDEHPRTAAFGYFDTSTLRSIRSRGGILHGNATINFLIAILDQAEADGLLNLEVEITFKRIGVTRTYRTTIETMRTHGELVDGVSGPELALPIAMWSIDGQAPTATQQPAPVAKVAATVEQPALFVFDEPRRIGGY